MSLRASADNTETLREVFGEGDHTAGVGETSTRAPARNHDNRTTTLNDPTVPGILDSELNTFVHVVNPFWLAVLYK